MKIRTDFVTNSSSESTAMVRIDNIVLLEILQRYKDMGVFADADPYFGVGKYDSNNFMFNEAPKSIYKTKTPAFFYYEYLYGEGWQKITGIPNSMDDVLLFIIDIMNQKSNEYDQELWDQMKNELKQRYHEIQNGYIDCRIYYLDILDRCIGDDFYWELKFDPKRREKFKVRKLRNYDRSVWEIKIR